MSNFKMLLILASLFTALPSSADVNLILTPENLVGADEMAILLKHPAVLEFKPVFSLADKKALLKLGQSDLFETYEIKISDSKVSVLRSYVETNKFQISVDNQGPVFANESVSEIKSEPLGARQWGLSNEGGSEPIVMDDLTTVQVPGKRGEDTGILGLGPMPKGREIVVAVLDTGIDTDHPDLVNRLVRKPKECEAWAKYQACKKTAKDKKTCDKKWATFDSDGNGYPMDCHGWNVLDRTRVPKSKITGSADVEDLTGHGSHVAGVIAAEAGNNYGIRGIAPNVKILPVKVLGKNPNAPVRPNQVRVANGRRAGQVSSFAQHIARGILYAVQEKADVIQMSISWPLWADALVARRLVAAAQEQGVVVVASASNDSTSARVMPCLYKGVICVASHGPDGSLSHFSNYGSGVDIAAPGLRILSTIPIGIPKVRPVHLSGQGFDYKNGTSFAAPFVSGAVARMLALKMSPNEIYARLLTGARPHSPERFRHKQSIKKYTRSGNLDLARSIKISPRPWVMPIHKLPIEVRWDRKVTKAKIEIKFQNYWANADSVIISGKLVSSNGVPNGAHLDGIELNSKSWKTGERKIISGIFNIDSSRLPSQQSLELNISETRNGVVTNHVSTVDIEVVVPLESILDDVDRFALNGYKPGRRTSLRSVTPLDGNNKKRDFISIELGPRKSKLTYLQQGSDSYSATASAEVPTLIGNLMFIQRLDVDFDGKSDLVFTYLTPASAEERAENKNTAGNNELHFFKSDLTPILLFDETTEEGEKIKTHILKHSSKKTVMPETWQWFKKEEKLVPAWISAGKTPDLEKPAFDPWNRNRKDRNRIRLYIYSEKGLVTVEAPEDLFYISLLPKNSEQQKSGEGTVLLGEGDDYINTYYVSTLKDGELSEPEEITIPMYRNLLGLLNSKKLISLDKNSDRDGLFMAGRSVEGRQRVTFLERLLDGEFEAEHVSMAPMNLTDSVMKVSGAFRGKNGRQGFFGETLYEIQYKDAKTGQLALTNLHRFGFIHSFVSSRNYFPVRVADRNQGSGKWLPGIYVPSGRTSIGVSQEVIVPHYSGNQLLGLSRPAAFRIDSGQRCQALNHVNLGNDEPTTSVFFCGSEIIQVPMGY